MAQIRSASVIVIGGGPVALLTALELHAAHIPVTIVGARFDVSPPPQNSEFANLSGDERLPQLAQLGRQLWKTLPARLGLPPVLAQQAGFLDLATSPGRAAKLREEAMLDALGGDEVSFGSNLPPYLGAGVQSVRNWPAAPAFVPGVMVMLQEAVAARGIAVLPGNVTNVLLTTPDIAPTVVMDDGHSLSAQHIVMACSHTAHRMLPASGFSLPLRPARGHVLTFRPARPQALPIILHRLRRGHMFIVPTLQQTVEVHYDGVLDPLQATRRQTPDDKLVQALTLHAQGLLPLLAGAVLQQVEVTTHWLTPDFLPAFGPWAVQPALILAVGWSSREMVFAGAVANNIARALEGDEDETLFAPCFAPNRFATGLWRRVEAPASLVWSEPLPEIVQQEAPEAEYMTKVQTVGKAEAQYAGTVKQVEKEIVKAERKPSPQQDIRMRSSKPKIQTASLGRKI